MGSSEDQMFFPDDKPLIRKIQQNMFQLHQYRTHAESSLEQIKEEINELMFTKQSSNEESRHCQADGESW